MKRAVILLTLFVLMTGTALSKIPFTESRFDPSVLKIKEDEYLGRFVPDVKVQTIDRGEVFLSELTNRPLILLLIYYDCPNICPLLAEGLASFLVLSFNKDDSIEKAIDFRERLKSRFKYSIEGWDFAIATEEAIKAITSHPKER